jgi:nucleoside-diphosphate-sugar epimerase
MSKITVLGASGFIGSHLAKKIRAAGSDCFLPGRDEDLSGRELGHVIYCIGLTADFRVRPFDTVEAHVCRLLDVLHGYRYDSFLYLSSTRVYASGGGDVAEETDVLRVRPTEAGDLYNISKIMGEATTLNCGGANARVARLSNVYGGDFNSDNFLSEILRDAITNGKVVLRTSPDSAKDYVSIDDVVEALIRIAMEGRHRIYNVAGGVNVSNGELLASISALTGCGVEVAPGAASVVFPRVSIERVREDFGFEPAPVLGEMERLVNLYTEGMKER